MIMVAKSVKIHSIGAITLIGFLATIPFANWWLDRFGMYDAPLIGLVPSGLWVVGVGLTQLVRTLWTVQQLLLPQIES